MHNKLIPSIKSLVNWSDKILIDSARKEWRLSDFVDTFNIKDYQKFYNELLPFVKDLKSDDNQMIENLVSTYEINGSVLSEAMKDNFLYEIFSSLLLNMPIIGRKADNLINAIKGIKSNSENLDYSLHLV
jgi:hypothetical protein